MASTLSGTAIHGPGAWKLWWLGNDPSNATPVCIGIFTEKEHAEAFKTSHQAMLIHSDDQYLITRGYCVGINFDMAIPQPQESPQ